ncbi:MAG: NAD(P)H-binding protein [Gordonia sp. (in: high G+C Gram-positive bacteria)]|uniref:NAD-dependent epimerase/dehydratase family protein n=1 Tax=Gordonia sp. (in: high G+C Gram-positive bacteria) TaxID=84139 RepID=UPI0039E643D3
MHVFVTGGTGAIGRYAVPALIAAGHRVSGLARSDAAAASLTLAGATPVHVSLFDVPALTDAFAGCDAVVNLASALPSTATFPFYSAWRECLKIRSAGSAAVVDAALAAGVPRVVQESVVMVYDDGGSAWLDESSPADPYPISRGNHAAEASALRFTEAGGSGTVLRFGLFYGVGAAHSEEIMAMARRHVGLVAGRPGSYQSSIHLADAASAVAAALEAAAGTYNVVDDEPLTKLANAEALADAVDRRRWVTGPGRAPYALGDRTTSLTRSLRVSNAKFRSGVGWSPRYPSVREGYVQMAAQL